MPLDPDQAFAYGFLLRCAEAGLGPDEAEGLAKRAFDPVGTAMQAGMWSLLPGVALGGLGGYALAMGQDRSADPASIRREELAAAYHGAADDAERRKALLAKIRSRQARPGLAGR
jgi:hypothetical protein